MRIDQQAVFVRSSLITHYTRLNGREIDRRQKT